MSDTLIPGFPLALAIQNCEYSTQCKFGGSNIIILPAYNIWHNYLPLFLWSVSFFLLGKTCAKDGDDYYLLLYEGDKYGALLQSATGNCTDTDCNNSNCATAIKAVSIWKPNMFMCKHWDMQLSHQMKCVCVFSAWLLCTCNIWTWIDPKPTITASCSGDLQYQPMSSWVWYFRLEFSWEQNYC